MHEKSTNYLTIQFDPTPVGKTSRLTFDILEFNKDRNFYRLVKDKYVDNLDEIFSVQYTNFIPKNKRGRLVIKYTPYVPFRQVCNFFEILEKDKHDLNLVIYGESTGPLVVCSINDLYFFQTNQYQQTQNIIELRNESTVNAPYAFDFDEEQSLFTVDKPHGTIEANKYVFIRVFYRGKKSGLYSTTLPCLIENYQPILINCYAVDNYTLWENETEVDPKDLRITNYPLPVEERTGFRGYMFDVMPVLCCNPPFSYSTKYINFGYVECNTTNTIALGFSITNHLKDTVNIIWNKDVNDIFKISPLQRSIKGQASAYFECYFQPVHKEKYYGSTISGLFFWPNPTKKEITMPIPLEMRFIGHTFPPDKGSWIPEVAIQPSKIILPPCLPSSCCYCTLTLRRLGILPVLFSFIPPKQTHYTLKPMQGLLKNDYIFIAIGLCPEYKEEKIYIEKWSLMLNGNPEHILNFEINGRTEFPTVLVGDSNHVTFANTHPNCQQNLLVKLCNNTRHSIRYEFLIPEQEQKNLEINQGEGTLVGHQCTYLLWSWTARNYGMRTIELLLKTTAIYYKNIELGKSLYTKILASGCTYRSELCAIPSKYNFKQCEFGKTISTTFIIYNFGESEIHYELKTLVKAVPINKSSENVTIDPVYETISPKGSQKITVSINPNHIGYYEIYIFYNIRKHMGSQDIVEKNEKALFLIEYQCVIPTLQVVDLSFTEIGPTVSKAHMWQMLCIDSINHHLKNICPDEAYTTELNFPDQLYDTNLTVFFMLKNITEFPTECNIKRLKICDCQKVKKNVSKTISKILYECPHRQIAFISPQELSFKKDSTIRLDINVKYKLCGLNKVGFTFHLSRNRQLNLILNLRTISSNVTYPSILAPQLEFTFKDIFIGDDHPVIQMFWLYNITKNSTKYSLIIENIDRFNEALGQKVITCINPIDTVSAEETHPIKFIFQPREMRNYEVSVPLLLGEKIFLLKLKGSGVVNYKNNYPALHGSMPKFTPYSYPTKEIKFSQDHIVLKPMPTQSVVEHLLLIQNISNDLIGYNWKLKELPDLIRIKIYGKKGILRSREKRILRLKIYSEKKSVLLENLILTCRISNITKFFAYQKCFAKYQKEKDDLKEQFTITEEGIFYPASNPKLIPKPKINHENISISCTIHTPDSFAFSRKQLKEFTKYKDCSLVVKEHSSNDSNIAEEIAKMGIIGNIIYNILKSEEFKEVITYLSKEPFPYYRQIKPSTSGNDAENANQFKDNSEMMDRNILNQILHKSVLAIITEMFGLQPVQNSTTKDSRS